MSPEPALSTLLPHPLPAAPQARLLLFAVRRMAAGGLDDAHAASALLANFGLGFRRPLVLLRALMAELSRVSQRRLALAPCCCNRATRDEAVLLDAVCRALDDAPVAHAALQTALGVRTALGALTSAQALAAAFADLGYPLAADQ